MVNISSLSAWQPVHTERHLVPTVSSVAPIDLHLNLPKDINAYALSKYVNIYPQVMILE